MTAAIYARFSSDLQDARSIEDQVAACRRLLVKDGSAAPAQVFADFALSGSTMATRPQLQALLAEVRGRRVTLVVAEALDRLSRDQADIALIHRTIRTNGARLVTLSEGEVDSLHIGLKGTMNQLFLEELARKTRRGLEGVAREGRIPGGRCFGYRAVAGKPGVRTIDEAEAELVQWIFSRYAAGESPRSLAKQLNARGAPSPRGAGWTASAINGDRRAGDGVLCQELYRGRLVFNRRRFVKDPETGRRRAELNPPEVWTVTDVPDLRIVTDAAWRAVQARRTVLAAEPAFQNRRRPQRLLSGLLRCGACGGAFAIVGSNRYACSTARERGTCDEGRTVNADAVEARVVEAIERQLLAPELIAEAVRAYHEELRDQRAQAATRQTALARDLGEHQRRANRLVDAIADGGSSPLVRTRLAETEAKIAEIETQLAQIAEPTIVEFHPQAAELYRAQVARLREDLAKGGLSGEARDAIRALIADVTVSREGDDWALDVRGCLALLLHVSNEKPPGGVAGGSSRAAVQLGAGARTYLRGGAAA